MKKKQTIKLDGVGELIFDAVSSGKITTEEYSKALAGIRIIKKLLK